MNIRYWGACSRYGPLASTSAAMVPNVTTSHRPERDCTWRPTVPSRDGHEATRPGSGTISASASPSSAHRTSRMASAWSYAPHTGVKGLGEATTA